MKSIYNGVSFICFIYGLVYAHGELYSKAIVFLLIAAFWQFKARA